MPRTRIGLGHSLAYERGSVGASVEMTRSETMAEAKRAGWGCFPAQTG